MIPLIDLQTAGNKLDATMNWTRKLQTTHDDIGPGEEPLSLRVGLDVNPTCWSQWTIVHIFDRELVNCAIGLNTVN